MKKLLVALLCMAPLSAMAFSTSWEHDLAISSGGTSVTLTKTGVNLPPVIMDCQFPQVTQLILVFLIPHHCLVH